MVLSGTDNTDFANGYLRLALEWTATQNITANTSTVTAKLYLQGLNANSTINASTSNSGYITIAGVKKTFTATSAITGTQKKLLSTATGTVAHLADGTKTLVLDSGFNVNVTFSGVKYDYQYAGGTFELTKINRASAVTLSDNEMNVGTAITVTTNRASSTYTHTIRYKYGSLTANIATGVTTSTVFNVPKTFASQTPNGISGTGTVFCDTFSGSTLIGTTSANFTAWIPDTAEFRPTITGIALADINTAITTQFGGYVQNRTMLNVKYTGAGVYGSTIRTQRVVANNEALTGNDVITNPLANSGAGSVVITVTDSRGRIATSTTAIDVLAYTDPAITVLTAKRVNADGTGNPQGTSVQVAFTASISPVDNKNEKLYEIRYKKVSDTAYTSKTVTADYLADVTTQIDALTADNAYNISIVATDYFGMVTRQTTVSTAFTLLDLRAGGKGLAIGKVSEKDALEVALPSEFSQPVTALAGVVNEARKAPTLLNSWANYGGEFTPASYWKDANGVVYLTGLISNSATAKYTVLFTLPAGYRPFGVEIMTVRNGDNAWRRVDILANGNVALNDTNFTNGWLSLANISFKAEN